MARGWGGTKKIKVTVFIVTMVDTYWPDGKNQEFQKPLRLPELREGLAGGPLPGVKKQIKRVKKCAVATCPNTPDGGKFVGNLCFPCSECLAGRGINSDASRERIQRALSGSSRRYWPQEGKHIDNSK